MNNDLEDVTSVSYSRGSVWRYVHHDKECQTEVKSDEIQQKFSELGLLLQRANAQEPAPENKSEPVVQPDTTGKVFALEVLVFELREKLAAFEVAFRQQEVELRQQSDKSVQLERENSELAVLEKKIQAELLTAIVHRNRARRARLRHLPRYVDRVASHAQRGARRARAGTGGGSRTAADCRIHGHTRSAAGPSAEAGVHDVDLSPRWCIRAVRRYCRLAI